MAATPKNAVAWVESSRSVSVGSKPRWMMAVPPTWKVGFVSMFRPPVWKQGSRLSVVSCDVRSIFRPMLMAL